VIAGSLADEKFEPEHRICDGARALHGCKKLKIEPISPVEPSSPRHNPSRLDAIVSGPSVERPLANGSFLLATLSLVLVRPEQNRYGAIDCPLRASVAARLKTAGVR
jgi:hypothetical protein